MQNFKTIWMASCLLMLTACSVLGIPPADTFDKRLHVGYTTVETVANSTNLLLTSGKMSKADAVNVLEQATNAKISLDIARSVHEGSPELGDSKLSSALLVLQALQVYIGGVK